jgi:hypothetical protein
LLLTTAIPFGQACLVTPSEPNHSVLARCFLFGLLLIALGIGPGFQATGAVAFDVKAYGATGKKEDDARPAIQRAIDACAAAGGGTVVLPAGEYTSGTLHLRSKVGVDIQTGAMLFASPDPKAYDFGDNPFKAALFYGEGLEDISIIGRGTVDGQAEYEWRLDDHERAFPHKLWMEELGKPLMRSFPKGFPKREIFPHLLWLGSSKNVRLGGLKFVHSPSWTLALYGCEEVVFDDLSIYSSLKEGVWADGIDLDGCKDVTISNCKIETGDDCIVFISENTCGPPRVCENITVTNCWLSSASAGVKFSEGNRAGIRKILVTHTILTNVNRGFIFSGTWEGGISEVVLSDLTIDCNRFDWFWAGDGQPFHFRLTRLSEWNHEPPKPGEKPPGTIRDVLIRNVVARAKGSSAIYGHAESWLEAITLENVKLSLCTDPAAPYDKARHALHFRWAKNLKLRDVEVNWEKPPLADWQSALCFEDIRALQLEGFAGRGAWLDRDAAAIVFNKVLGAVVRNSRALEGTKVFLSVLGEDSRDIGLQDNDLRQAKVAWHLEPGVKTDAIKTLESTEVVPKDPTNNRP